MAIKQDTMLYVTSHLPVPERLAALAEESVELAKAALKLRRVYDGTSPTPVREEDAIENLREEIADVWLTIHSLGLDEEPFITIYQNKMAEKSERWATRIAEREAKMR